MSQTPYVETGALLAVMAGDEDEALRILDDMYPGERRSLVGHLNRLSLLADDSQRCPRCKMVVDPLGSVMVVSSGYLGGPREQWHQPCLDAQRADEG